jgi:hypothetical protein
MGTAQNACFTHGPSHQQLPHAVCRSWMQLWVRAVMDLDLCDADQSALITFGQADRVTGHREV